MDKTLNNIDTFLDDSLYNELLLTENIMVPPDKFNSNINSYLEESLKLKNEQKCISEGFIKKNSIEILKKSIGTLKGSQFHGNINYLLMYKALVCSPKNGSIIKCKVKLVNNKLGLLGSNGPLTIIVGKQLHNNPMLLDEINVDDIIEIKIIESKFSLNDKEIRIIGKLKIDGENAPRKNTDVEVDDLNEIDAQDIDDANQSISNNDINDIDLESLDSIDSESEDDEEEMDDIDEMKEDEDMMDDDQDDRDIDDDQDIDDEIENNLGEDDLDDDNYS